MQDIIVADILSLVFGCISVIMSISIEIPQLISIFKTKNTSGTSLTTYILFLVSSLLWASWAVLNYAGAITSIPENCNLILHVAALVPAMLSNILNLFLVGCILFLKMRSLYNCKKYKVSEIKYSKIVFDKQKGYSWFRKYWPILLFALLIIILSLVIVLILYLIGIPPQDESLSQKLKYVVLTLNILAAVFFESVSWPQFIKCLKSKDTSGISLGWAIFLPLSCIMCWVYDLCLAMSNGYLTVIASLICSGIFINIGVLILKIRNMVKAKKLGISEWKYTNDYLSK